MNLNTDHWMEFKVGRILNCSSTKMSVRDDLPDGQIPFVSRTAENNGVDGFVDVESRKITQGNCLTIGAEGVYAFFQPEKFATGNKIYQLRNEHLNKYVALFLTTILNLEAYKYSYGRARVLSKLKEEIIKLPVRHNKNNSIFIDRSHKYSDLGYVPDWEFMENYIKSLNHEPLGTVDLGGIRIKYSWV